MTVAELHARLAEFIADGCGDLPACGQTWDGLVKEIEPDDVAVSHEKIAGADAQPVESAEVRVLWVGP